jgi:bifunctional non-homologous end joining protein LigD
VKYDGFRCIALLDHSQVVLQSRQGKELHDSFPEVADYLQQLIEDPAFQEMLPLIIDCELVILTSSMKANFERIQKRGRTKTKSKVKLLAEEHPATLLAFDILRLQGSSILTTPFSKRKEKMEILFKKFNLPLMPLVSAEARLQFIPFFSELDEVWSQVQQEQGEGIIAKKRNSLYSPGKRTTEWIKVKNYKTATCFITAYQKENGYFHVGVFKDGLVQALGLFSHGLSSEERTALITVIKENCIKEEKDCLFVNPGICVDLFYLELYQDQLRHPEFKQFRFDMDVKKCTWESLTRAELPESVAVTHPDKPLWEEPRVTKQDYLHFLSEVSPFLLPFIKNRLLTVIRFPHGMYGESFYQKNCPDYAPDFVETHVHEGILYLMCNNLETLIWLGNQLALEFHIPFQTYSTVKPGEIVFDLDPPSKVFFSAAVKGALMMKEVFDQLQLKAYVKTSGRKGLQVYIPLPEESFTYDDTRKFTEFIAQYLVSKEPSLFTVERLKKHRGEKVYVDYIQHAEGKTIIAPYSLRGNDLPTVAAPLYWDEVKEGIQPDELTLFSVLERIKEIGNPFHDFMASKSSQPFEYVLSFLKNV